MEKYTLLCTIYKVPISRLAIHNLCLSPYFRNQHHNLSSGSGIPIWASKSLCAFSNAQQCQETIVPTWLLMLKGRRSICFSHTVATGLAKLCPTSTSRLPLKTASPDPPLFVPSTSDPSRLLRWLACPPSILLTNYMFWLRNTGINQKRRTVRSVGHFFLYHINPD